MTNARRQNDITIWIYSTDLIDYYIESRLLSVFLNYLSYFEKEFSVDGFALNVLESIDHVVLFRSSFQSRIQLEYAEIAIEWRFSLIVGKWSC
jgi:hypothetical protein